MEHARQERDRHVRSVLPRGHVLQQRRDLQSIRYRHRLSARYRRRDRRGQSALQQRQDRQENARHAQSVRHAQRDRLRLAARLLREDSQQRGRRGQSTHHMEHVRAKEEITGIHLTVRQEETDRAVTVSREETEARTAVPSATETADVRAARRGADAIRETADRVRVRIAEIPAGMI